MALAHIQTIGRLGIKCFPMTIEVDVSPGLPSFSIVGLPDTIVQESKERIRAAIKNSGATWPLSRITVNLAPADIKKEGVGFDLPIAIGIIIANEELPEVTPDDYFYGELGLQGEVKATRGVLALLRNAQQAKRIFIPQANAPEASLIQTSATLYGLPSLQQAMRFFKNETTLEPIAHHPLTFPDPAHSRYDFADIHGQQAAKRALEICAAGHHNILLRGSPGAGKTLLSRALPSIMPPLNYEETLETTQIYSIAGLLGENQPFITERPFRSPHHSASMASIVGGGNPPRPGEITLSHNGVLFLDEFAEFPRNIIESLRQPLEDRTVTVARSGYSAEFPAHCLLVTAINPCPCGYKDDPKQPCTCTPQQMLLYQKKLSGPILDRIDIHIIVPPVAISELTQTAKAEPSAAIRKRVIAAREKQYQRYKPLGFQVNSQLPNKDIHHYCQLEDQAKTILEQAIDSFKLSARAYHKVLKVARTIADLNNDELISAPVIAEAIQYRPVRLTT